MRIDCTHPRANHQHGTYLAFKLDGCHCDDCTRAHRAQCKRTRHRTITGTHTYTDAAPAREHVTQLLGQGITIGQIEQRSGVHRTAIRVLIGDYPGRPTSKRITRKTESALLAVRGTRLGPETSGLVDPTGTRRRIQALVALGYMKRDLATRLGWSTRTFHDLITRNRPVLASTRANVIALYDDLSMQVPPAGRGATRSRNYAKKHGWLPPLAWDDDLIDDPTHRPQPDRNSRGDLLEDYQWLIDAGESHHAACKALGVTPGAIEKARARAERTAA